MGLFYKTVLFYIYLCVIFNLMESCCGEIIGFIGANYTGDVYKFPIPTNSCENVPLEITAKIGSIQLTNCVMFYGESECKGEFFQIPPGNYTSLSTIRMTKRNSTARVKNDTEHNIESDDTKKFFIRSLNLCNDDYDGIYNSSENGVNNVILIGTVPVILGMLACILVFFVFTVRRRSPIYSGFNVAYVTEE